MDEYINLKSRVETRMRISVMTSTGDYDLINPEEKGDLEYRRSQLKKLQEEVVDLEDMTSGVSIMDLGLNEFRMDLLAYMKEHGDIDHTPFGIHAVVKGEKPGVVFVLKKRERTYQHREPEPAASVLHGVYRHGRRGDHEPFAAEGDARYYAASGKGKVLSG